MAKGFYRQIVKILRNNNCYFVREGAGDHEIWHSPINNRNVAVDKGCKSRLTANAIFKQCGINYKV